MFKHYKKKNNLDKSRWDEDSYEFALEKELEESRNMATNIESTASYIDENTLLEKTNGSALIHELYNYEYSDMMYPKEKITGILAEEPFKLAVKPDGALQKQIQISRNADIINQVYLEVDMSTIDNMLDLFDITFEVRLDHKCTYYANVGVALTQQMFFGNSIKENDDTIQIPIANFNTLKPMPNITGFPVVSSSFTYRYFYISSKYNEAIANTAMNLLVESTVLVGSTRSKLARERFELLYLNTISTCKDLCKTSINNNRIIIDRLVPETESYSFIIKYIIVILKTSNTLSKPEIESAEVKELEGNRPRQSYYWNAEEIITIDVCGIRQYIIPISQEFKDVESMKTTFSDPETYLTLDGIAGSISLSLNIDYIDMDCRPIVFFGGYSKIGVGDGMVVPVSIENKYYQ